MDAVDESGVALLAYARRRIDASTAVARVCASVAGRSSPPARCVLVGIDPRAPSGFSVLGRAEADVEASALARIVADSSAKRLLFGRAEQPWLARELEEAEWVAVEPVESRSGRYLGSLVAYGAVAGREHVLPALPSASLLCADIAFETLTRNLLTSRLHRFNNVLAVLSATVEQLAIGLETSEGSIEAKKRELLASNGEQALEALEHLLEASAALHDAMPFETTRR